MKLVIIRKECRSTNLRSERVVGQYEFSPCPIRSASFSAFPCVPCIPWLSWAETSEYTETTSNAVTRRVQNVESCFHLRFGSRLTGTSWLASVIKKYFHPNSCHCEEC